MSAAALPPIWMVVPAAGIGSRMGKGVPKQYRELCGRPVAEITLSALLELRTLRELVVAIAAADSHWQALDASIRERVTVVEGGADRAQSVMSALCGFREPPGENDWVLVHDMARPCISSGEIESLVAMLASDQVGGLLALPVTDTLKRSGRDGRVEATVDRSAYWRAQTPQMFRFGLLRRALATARERGLVCSDESMAVEALGFRPRLVPGAQSNIKLTLDEDLAAAARVLQNRETMRT